MANMSYCRFENTFSDLEDCKENLFKKLSRSENGYRERLIELCQEIIEMAEEVDFDFSEIQENGSEDED